MDTFRKGQALLLLLLTYLQARQVVDAADSTFTDLHKWAKCVFMSDDVESLGHIFRDHICYLKLPASFLFEDLGLMSDRRYHTITKFNAEILIRSYTKVNLSELSSQSLLHQNNSFLSFAWKILI